MPHGHYRARRGIGNIIAGVVFIFLLVFTIGQLYAFSLAQLDEYNTAFERMLLTDVDRTNEKLAITSLNVDFATNTVTKVTVSNTGTLTARIVSLWVILPTTNSHTRSSQNVFVPAAGSADITVSIPATQPITLRVVSERGNSATVSMLSAQDNSAVLTTQLTLVPPNPVTQNTLIANFIVTNNLVSGQAVYNLKPDMQVLQAGVPCTLTTTPVSCKLVSGPTPSSFNLLLPGSTVAFQWIYQLNTTVPDATATFTTSYESPFSGALPSQTASATATVRQVGGAPLGASSLSSIVGALTIDITSFQFAKVQAGSLCWKTGFQIKGSDSTVLRVKVTNIGSTTVTLNQNSEFVVLRATTGGGGQLQPLEFFIASGAQVTGGLPAPVAMPNGGGVTVVPGQTVALYLGSDSQTSSVAPILPPPNNRLFTFFVLLGTQTGSITTFGQSIPFVGLSITNQDPAGCFSGPY